MNIGISTYRGYDSAQPDRSALIGVLLVAGLLVLTISIGGRFLAFFDLPSALLVLGGTFAAGMIQYSWQDLSETAESAKHVLQSRAEHVVERINMLVALGTAVRKDGLLVLENATEYCPDVFMRHALELAVDGQTPDEMRRILENEMMVDQQRAAKAVQVFATLANYAPGFGLIGTLVGLVQMLGVLHEPSAIGPGMALALIATLYGALLSNLVCLPLAGKIRNRAAEEDLLKRITVEGVVSVARQENPVMLEQKLQSFLPRPRIG